MGNFSLQNDDFFFFFFFFFFICICSPWTDKYETAEQNLYTKPVQAFLVSRMEQLKSEAVVFTRDEYITSVARPHPQCCLAEVGHGRKGLVAQLGIPQDELVIECKVRRRERGNLSQFMNWCYVVYNSSQAGYSE